MAQSPTPLPVTSRRSRVRSIGLAIVLWAFGLSTTTLLVGVWGRSVAADQATMSASIEAALDPESVADQITDWIVTEAVSLPGSSSAEVEAAVQQTAASPAARLVIEALVEDFIAAASAPPGSSTVIDVRASLEPLRTELATSIAAADVHVSEPEVDGLLAQVEGLVLTSSEPVLAANPVARARSALTVVMLVGAGCLLLFGSLATILSGRPLSMLRSLANRLVVSAITFVLFLRIGAWAMDPGGGRSPLRAGGAVLLGSNQGVLWALAIAGLAISVGLSRLMRGRRPVRGANPPSDPPSSAEPVFASARR